MEEKILAMLEDRVQVSTIMKELKVGHIKIIEVYKKYGVAKALDDSILRMLEAGYLKWEVAIALKVTRRRVAKIAKGINYPLKPHGKMTCTDQEIIDMYLSGKKRIELVIDLHTSYRRVNKLTKNFTCTDKQILDLYFKGTAKRDVVRLLHTNTDRVTSVILKNKEGLKKALDSEIVDMYMDGNCSRKILQKLKTTSETIKKVLRVLPDELLMKAVASQIDSGTKTGFIARTLGITKDEVLALHAKSQGYKKKLDFFDLTSNTYVKCPNCGSRVIEPCLACQLKEL